MRVHRITPAEKLAVSLAKLMTDFHIDLETVGYYIYRTMPPLIYNRFQVIAEAAEHERKLATDPEYKREWHNIERQR